jgi:hypothetical protein
MSLQHAPRRNFRPIIRCSPWVAALAVSLATYPPARAVPATGPATEPSANPTTQPGTQPAPDEAKPRHRPAPESFLRSQRQQRDMSRNMFSNIRQGATYRLDALLQFRMVKGIMDIQTAAVPVGEQTRIKVEGSNAVWIGFRQPQNFNVAFPGAPLAVTTTASTITRVDPDVKADDEVWSTYINVSGDNFWIMGQSVCGRVNINQSNGHGPAARVGTSRPILCSIPAPAQSGSSAPSTPKNSASTCCRCCQNCLTCSGCSQGLLTFTSCSRKSRLTSR